MEDTKWVAYFEDNFRVTEDDGTNWNKIDIRKIQRFGLIINGMFEIVIDRTMSPFPQDKTEFVQFRTALFGAIASKIGDTQECHAIGWTDGKTEFMLRIRPETTERIHHHPTSENAPENIKALWTE